MGEPILISLLHPLCPVGTYYFGLIKQGKVSARGWQRLFLERQPSVGSLDPLGGLWKCVGHF